MKYVAFYDVAPEAMPNLPAHFPAHRARLDEFHGRGLLVAAGPYGNPPEGALAIFNSREAAEEFIEGDPFVVNGLVAKWRIVEWAAVFI
ncbi:MAG TPA: YciI family protein [Gemmatimonadaceae bacterium]